MKSVLFLSKYARNGASSRYRTFRYLPLLGQASIYHEISPLFSHEHLNKIYKSQSVWQHVAGALFRRLMSLLTVRQFDLIVIEYEILPYFLALFERLLEMIVSYVVVYVFFHQSAQHGNIQIQRRFEKKIAAVMWYAQMVIYE